MAVDESYLTESQALAEKGQGIEFYLSVIRRRWIYFLIPFLAVLCVGTLVAMLMRPIYRSEARILVQSQQIPTDLVRPTVTASAEERIQVIAQRIMTRDNLMAIVNKFKMFPNWRASISDSDLVDLMRERASITPVAMNFAGSSNRNSTALAFTIGFEYEEPQVATRVANELVTLILNEDVRSRTSRASETSKFLSQEVDRLENERLAIEAQIGDLRRRSNDIGAQQAAEQLAALKAALMQKSAIYSESHPDIVALKERIRALQQSGGDAAAPPPPQAIAQENGGGAAAVPAGDSTEQGAQAAPVPDNVAPENTTISLLQSKESSVQQDLDKARERLLAARQGERLEEDQQSERFEVIEQPSVPQEPIKPNRKKILAMGLALSVVAGFGGVFAIESYDKTIRGTADLPMPPRLVVTIPYISTRAEIERSRKRLKVVAGAAAVALIAILIMIHFLVLPLDLLFEKITNRLIGV